MKIFERLARRFGYKLLLTSPVDLRELGCGPVEAIYRVPNRPSVVEADLSTCRTGLGFTYLGRNRHALVRTAQAIIEGEATSYKTSPLWEMQAHFRQTGHPPGRIGLFLPWQVKSRTRSEESIRRENQERGRDLSANEGGTGFRYMSDEKGELEFKSLTHLVESMKRGGYRRDPGDDGDVMGYPIIRNGESRLVITRGKHRAAVAVALGYASIPIRILPLRAPRFEESSNWPMVRSGRLSQEQAEFIFDRMFNGKPDRVIVPAGWR